MRLFCFLLISTFIMNNSLSAQHLFLLAGQSNASGQGDSILSNQLLSSLAYEYNITSDDIKPLKDPVGQNWKLLQTSNSGSVAPAFTRKFSSLTNKHTILITASRGGSSCNVKAMLANYDTWDYSGSLFDQTIEKTNKAILKSGLQLTGVIWMQGERDANAINDGVLTSFSYKNSLIALINRFKIEYGPNLGFYIVQTGYQSGRPKEGNDAVRSVQEQVANELKNVFIVYSETDLFFEKKWMKDNVHYNQVALNHIGEQSAINIYSLLQMKNH